MRTAIKISKHLGSITKENLLTSRRVLSFTNSNGVIWKGTKRYAH
ncbi:hypothetical protein [Hwangdonia seohaensis]|uniref:Uncharacterized protein n=1 Tax=Hwangdonia seohaensis TaxID=1240727 RepID=A0ABW3RB55_9FLAO|nr:hypothetical protein [Hwangdonia seohaensis]